MIRGEETNKKGTEGERRKEADLYPLAVARQSLQAPLIYYGCIAVDLPVVDISCRNEFYIKCFFVCVVGVFLFSSKVYLCCYIHQHLIS